jgi:hypothetical protein
MRHKPGLLLVIFAIALASVACASDKTETFQTYKTMKAWDEAIKKQDMAAYKNVRTNYMYMNNTKMLIGDYIYNLGFSDENVKKAHATDGIKLRNEKITHDNELDVDLALIEWQDAGGAWRPIQLIKEKGQDWKVYRFIN